MTHPAAPIAEPKEDTVTPIPLNKAQDPSLDEANMVLNNLLEQGKRIHGVQSNLALLMKRYNVEKSYFSQLAEWYGEKPLFEKIALGSVVVYAGNLVGLLFGLSQLLAVLSAQLYFAFDFFLTDHYTTTKSHNTQFCKDIIEMEASLTKALDEFSVIETKLNTILVSLNALHAVQANNIVQFEGQIAAIGKHAQEAQRVANVSNALGTCEASISADEGTLTQIKATFQKNMEAINVLQGKMSDVVSKLDTQLNNSDAHQNAPQVLTEVTPATEVVASANAFIDNAEDKLAGFEQRLNQMMMLEDQLGANDRAQRGVRELNQLNTPTASQFSMN